VRRIEQTVQVRDVPDTYVDTGTTPKEADMQDTLWTWASLDEAAARLVTETEQKIGADVVLIYSAGEPVAPAWTRRNLAPAPLDDAAVAELRALEARTGGVAVAYMMVAA
jgi:hypothetical protein